MKYVNLKLKEEDIGGGYLFRLFCQWHEMI